MLPPLRAQWAVLEPGAGGGDVFLPFFQPQQDLKGFKCLIPINLEFTEILYCFSELVWWL